MRYPLLTLALATAISTFALSASAPSMDQIAVTKHNFTNPASPFYALLGQSSAGDKYSICQPCHTPHHAVTETAEVSARSWNHVLSNSDYTLYDGARALYTGQSDGSQGMDRVSRLCLGCHDGTIALDAFGMDGAGGRFAGTTPFLATSINNLGVDFHDDHPVGIVVPVATASGALPADSHLKTPTVTYNTIGDPASGIKSVSMTVDNEAYSRKLRLVTIAGSPDAGFYYVGCRTCHNPHGTGDAPLTPFSHLLNCKPESLCTSCHYK